jgi:hypothetical protein
MEAIPLIRLISLQSPQAEISFLNPPQTCFDKYYPISLTRQDAEPRRGLLRVDRLQVVLSDHCRAVAHFLRGLVHGFRGRYSVWSKRMPQSVVLPLHPGFHRDPQECFVGDDLRHGARRLPEIGQPRRQVRHQRNETALARFPGHVDHVPIPFDVLPTQARKFPLRSPS